MDPFQISTHAAALKSNFPELSLLLNLLSGGSEAEIHGLCRLWISEGAPHLFSEEPMMYEVVREWTARRLGIHPKELTLIGSARAGYSLAPPPKLGKIFGAHSDLDLVAISQDLFNRCELEFKSFASDLDAGRVVPPTDYMRRLWPEIVSDMTRTSQNRGFLDTWKVPFMDRYPLSQKIGNTCWLLSEKLKVSSDCYSVKKASLRVYKDFHSFVRQIRINLFSLS